jgi:hypothetical protein
VLTPEQRVELGFDRPPLSAISPSVLYNGQVASCSVVDSVHAVSVGITLVTTNGIERFADPALRVRTVATRASGFPALVIRPDGLTTYCMLAVDVAPGQLIEIQYSDIRQAPPVPLDDLCRSGLRAADAAIVTLLAH